MNDTENWAEEAEKAVEEAPIVPDNIEEMIQEAAAPRMHGWKATHEINGVLVMKIERKRANGGHLFPIYRKEDGTRVYGGNYRKAIPLEPAPKIVDPLEAAWQQGFKAGEEAALTQSGNRAKRAGQKVYHRFRTRDLSTAFSAIMGAHEGSPLCLSVDGCEGELKHREADGSYIVAARLYNWTERRHYVYWIRIPQEMTLEVVGP